jgi:hypothetical protein
MNLGFCLPASFKRGRKSSRALLLISALVAGLLVLISALIFVTGGSAVADAHDSAAEPAGAYRPPTLAEGRLWYRVRGTGVMTIDGPGCCQGANFPGTFEMDYRPDVAGRIEITRLQTSLPDMDIAFRFLIFETKRVTVRCGQLNNDGSVRGDVDSFNRLTIPPSSFNVSGSALEKRNANGECSGESFLFTGRNNSALRGVLDPSANYVALAGAFNTRVEGNDYNLTLEMTGTYGNRPPRARLGVTGRNLEAFAQGGCPAYLNAGNPPELVVEANDPAGLKMTLRSHSYDPDGAWNRADLDLNKWFYGRDSGPLNYVAEGLEHGPMTFAFGARHRLVLETADRMAAATTDDCSFRVVDTTAPAVTPPALISAAATFRGGAVVRNSPAIRRFLDGATCSDLVDPAPAKLPPLLGERAVTNATIFPIGYSTVTFRCRDRFGNTGTAQSRVKVSASK